MPESIITIFADGKKLVKHTEPGPTSYVSPVNVRIGSLKRAEHVIGAFITGGYEIEPIEYATGNIVGYKVYYQTGVSGAPKAEVASGLDLSGETITLFVLGW